MTNAEHMGWPWDGCSIKLRLQLQIDLQSLTVWLSGLNQGDLFSICYISIYHQHHNDICRHTSIHILQFSLAPNEKSPRLHLLIDISPFREDVLKRNQKYSGQSS